MEAPAARCHVVLLLAWTTLCTGLRRPSRDIGKQDRGAPESRTEKDPFEKVHHYDDWVSIQESKFLNLSRDICVRNVPSPRSNCVLLSQTLCDAKSKGLSSLSEGHGACIARRGTCAVVGSSHHLLNASWGSFIDSHDVVIRINAAPAGSADASKYRSRYSDHVGTRTDARFVNLFGHLPDDESDKPMCIFLHEPFIPEQCGRMCWRNPGFCNVTCGTPYSTDAICVKKPCDLSGLSCRGNGMRSEKDWGNNYVFMEHLYGGLADQIVPHSTAGFKAVLHAMSVCDKVSVLGFGPTCDGRTGTRYYTGNGYATSLWHHYDEELELLRKAKAKGTKAIIPPDARGWIHASSAWASAARTRCHTC
mmetsp:Transcript_54223/g.168166  ORF Transcript_54223/g.168166 Transcript_54223/m.168166 type:complete len:363 (+) Transcript_54223:59-1147(+)